MHLNDTIFSNNSADATRIVNAFAALRNARRAPAGPADGRPNDVTDVRMFRNWEIFCVTALRVTGDPNNVCVPPSAGMREEERAGGEREGEKEGGEREGGRERGRERGRRERGRREREERERGREREGGERGREEREGEERGGEE